MAGMTAIVRYTVPRACKVAMEIYSMQGRRVATLVNAERQPGNYAVPLATHRLASGSYVLSFKAGEFTDKQRVIW
jgi:5-hydroxyisourate hydrolase-like protein (transthyretin family)